jgi:N-methylhydantoinase A/oxoprolinase/acetone carboxylase beta subunit
VVRTFREITDRGGKTPEAPAEGCPRRAVGHRADAVWKIAVRCGGDARNGLPNSIGGAAGRLAGAVAVAPRR